MRYTIVNEDSKGHKITSLLCDTCGSNAVIQCDGSLACPGCGDLCKGCEACPKCGNEYHADENACDACRFVRVRG